MIKDGGYVCKYPTNHRLCFMNQKAKALDTVRLLRLDRRDILIRGNRFVASISAAPPDNDGISHALPDRGNGDECRGMAARARFGAV